MSKHSPEIDHLLVLRGVACLCVMANHLLGISFGPYASSAASNLIDVLTPFGFPFVWIFFFLSSYLLMIAFINGRFELGPLGVTAYFQSRFWRLALLALGLGVFVSLLYAAKSSEIFPMIYQSHIYNLSFFLAGALCAYHNSWRPRSKSDQLPILGWVSLIVTIVFIHIVGRKDLDLTLRFGGTSILLGSWIFFRNIPFDFQRPLVRTGLEYSRLFKSGWSGWFECAGVMSYSIYLLHKPIGYLLLNVSTALGKVLGLGSLGQVLMNFGFGFGLTLIFCIGCYFLIEVRFRRGFSIQREKVGQRH